MRPATAAEVTPCASAARGGNNNRAIVASMPHDQTTRFIRTISGMRKGIVFGRGQTWPPPERSSIRASVTFASLLTCAGGSDRKSTRLNSSHLVISYAVFCLKKKKKKQRP